MALVAAADLRTLLMSQPQLAVVLFAGAVWLFKLINRAKAAAPSKARGQADAGRPEPAGRGIPAGPSADDEERKRRVREDILQMIGARRAEAAAAAVAKTASQGTRRPAAGTAAPGFTERQPVSNALPQGPLPVPSAGALPGGAPGPLSGALWLDDLRTRDSARRAILVREILGPPVGLR